MTYKKLDVELEPIIQSECWTYYKFAIMQKSPFFNDWLASHMNMCMDNRYDSGFGDCGYVHTLSYFSELLEISEVNLCSINEDEIIPFLIEQINHEQYVVVDFNYKKLFKLEMSEFEIHETLIYGYDLERQIFFLPALQDGVFVETAVDFEHVKASYADSYNYYLERRGKRVDRREYFLGITLLSLKQSYDNINKYFDFLGKLKNEIRGNIYTRIKYADKDNPSLIKTYYTGLPCVLQLINMVQDYIDDVEKLMSFRVCRLAFIRVLENQRIILRLMKWFYIEMDVDNQELKQLESLYEKCISDFYLSLLLFYKAVFSDNKEILYRIKDRLRQIYDEEEPVLKQYYKLARNIYAEKLVGSF